jgi:membrane protease YdiL (CAAX protease family)
MTRKKFMADVVRPIGLSFVFVSFGSLLALCLKVFLKIEVPTLISSAITFVFAVLAAFYLFPLKLHLPFGDVGQAEYMRRLGFYFPQKGWKHILLGILLAVCTLSGIFISSLITGRYKIDWSTVNLTHIIFSINPGLWEEVFYRGIIMFILLRVTKSVRQASIIQIIIFGLAHIKGFGLWSWIDVISVIIIAIAFTYSAYKTHSLVVGIVFHFLHDAFLFLPQVPGGEYIGISENIAFYACLWIMVGVGCLLIKFSADKLAVKADKELYLIEHSQDI